MAQPCVICHAGDADVVCDDDRQALAEQLSDIPRMFAALALRLLPGGASDGPRVATTKVGAPTPVSERVLNLLAAGNEQVSGVLHPLIRRWSVTTTVRVQTVVNGQTVVEERRIPQWFTERVHGPDGKPVMVPDDDQIGVIPPREWLDTTVRAWRSQLGHHVPARSGRVIAHRAGTGSRVTIWPAAAPSAVHRWTVLRLCAVQLRSLLSTPAGRWAFCVLNAVEAYRRQRVNRHLGLLSSLDTGSESLDPLADELETRFGEPPRSQALAWDVDYLLTWLDTACDRDLGIADFAAELGALTAEMARALGEGSPRTWIGRCPAFLVEELPAEPGAVPVVTRKPCGAGLWHQPGWAQVPCPRCHSTWDVRGPSAVRTAREIRRVWPIDRRRRYTADEIDRLNYPACPACRCTVHIDWREATGQNDKTRTWQPVKATCPSGHDDAGRTL